MTGSPANLGSLLHTAAAQGSPLNILRTFLAREEVLEKARQVDRMRFVGYVLDLGYDNARIITSDPYKIAVGGIPRGSFLIMTPTNPANVPLHFTLLRVTGVSTTPLSTQVQQTYFELHKKAMPELDIWTQSELQWGALDCDVLGMFYSPPENATALAFSGDVNNVVSAHRYKVFAPDEALLNLIVNGTVRTTNQYAIGHLRPTECGLTTGFPQDIAAMISIDDLKGARTAMFGKTRLGKSNVVKLIAKGILESTATTGGVGQLIFDVNGEYANDNPQDDNSSLRSAYPERCVVYALTARSATPSKPLRLNFFEQPAASLGILASLLEHDNRSSGYVKSFASVELPDIPSILQLPLGERVRPVRRIQMFWAVLHKAGFAADATRLAALGLNSPSAKGCDPSFAAALRNAAYGDPANVPAAPSNLAQLVRELETVARFMKQNPTSPALQSTGGSGAPILDADDKALLTFLEPAPGNSGPVLLRPYLRYHAADAGDFVKEILALLDASKTVILDLGNANDELRRYFADMLSRAVFSHQEEKFVSGNFNDHYVQLYFEEAHNLFPVNDREWSGVYVRFAKEGAKFRIGMVYSTQSPSTINRELLIQTENFFVGHLSAEDEAKALGKLQVCFKGVEADIMKARTPGYMRMLTQSHRFVIPIQAHRFTLAPS